MSFAAQLNQPFFEFLFHAPAVVDKLGLSGKAKIAQLCPALFVAD